jgi:hypothetical protein
VVRLSVRSPGVVGPYWLGPPSVPLARMVVQARSASRFSDTRVERGVVANDAFYHSLFNATAEYHRSDESPGSCAGPGSVRCVRGAEHRVDSGGYCASGNRGGTRGWDSIIQASNSGQARGERPENRIALRFCSHDGPVLGLGPFVTLAFRREGRSSL